MITLCDPPKHGVCAPETWVQPTSLENQKARIVEMADQPC